MKKLSLSWFCATVLSGACLSFSAAHAQTQDKVPVPVDVLFFLVEGNHVLPPVTVERVLAPFMGPAKSFKDIEAAREALEKAYQDAGFLSVVVSLPNQRIVDGEVRLEVTEASVEKVKVTGAKYNLPSKLREAVPSVAVGEVPYFPQVQDELGALQTGSLQVTPLISAGDAPDKIQVELKVDDKHPARGAIELNSRQSFNTSRGRVDASASYSNLFQLGHTLGMSWQYAPDRPADANTISLVYDLPLGVGDALSASVTNSRSDTPTGTAIGGATLTRGTFYGLRWSHDLRAFNWGASHSVSVGLDYKHNQDRSTTGSGFSTEKPALVYPVLGLGYDLNWNHSDANSTALRTSLGASSRALSGRTVDCDGKQLDQFACKRSGSSPDFLVWKWGVTHRRALGAGWQLKANADAQLSSGPLASGEQYSLGGVDTIRGYYDYEQSGDQGWNARLEAITPALIPDSSWRLTSLAFFDRGAILLKNPIAGQVARVSMGSYGLGLRLETGFGLQAALDYAVPVFATTRAADDGGYEPTTKRNKPRWELSVRQAF